MDASSKGSTREFVTRNDSKGIPNNKTGNVFTGSMHVFCGVVGAGVLALPYSVSWLGWVAGPTLVIVFYAFSLLSSFLLASLFEVNGIEHSRYHHLVSHVLGSKSAIMASVFQLLNIFLTTIAYTITGANSLVAIAQIACDIEGKDLDSSSCFSPSSGGIWKMTLVFGGVELFLSQVRNLEEAWWVSVIGTLGSLIYAFIAMILSLVHAGNREGSVGGRSSTSANKAFNIMNALGAIGFAYNFSLILPEIQDTLKQPPSAIRTMKKVCSIAITGAFFFYFIVAVAGYAALGDEVTEIVLDSFCGPNWAIMLAQIAILLHMFTAYQVFGQAMFNTLESHVKYYNMRRAAKKKDAFVPDTIEEGEEETEESSQPTSPSEQAGLPITPFEKTQTAEVRPSKKQHHYDTHMLGFEHHQLNPIESRLSSTLSTALTERELSSVMWRLHSAEDKSQNGRQSGLSMFRMYSADTGFANEEVPLNDEGFVLPFQYRLVIRSIYVGLITLLACVMPFFSAFAGLVGAVTYFPLAIYFPFTCYRKVFPVKGMFSKLLWFIFTFTMLVAIAATIGSLRTIIVGWSTYQIFGDYKIELELNNHVAARMTMITRMSIVGIRNPSPLWVEKGFYAPKGRIPGFSLQKRYQSIKMYSNGERMVLQRDLLRQCYQTFDVRSIQGLVSENLDVLDNETSLHILCYLADHAKKSQLVIAVDDDCDQLVAALCGQVQLEELTTVSSAALVWTLEVLPHGHGHSWRRRLLVNIVTRELERDEFDQYSTRELLNFTMSCSNLSTNVGVDRRVVRFMAAVLSELSSRLEKPHVRSAFGGSEFADLASSVAALFVACHESGVQEGCKVVNGFMTSLSAEVRRKLSNRHSSARSFNPKELKQFLMAYVSVHSRDDTLNPPCMLDTVASFVASRIKSKHLNAVSRIEDVAAVLEFFTFFSHRSLAVVDLFSSSGYQLRLLSASALDTMTKEEPGNVGENHARATAAQDVNWIGALASILQCHIKMGYRPNDTTLIALVPAVKYHQVAAGSHDKAALLRAFDILDFNCGRNLTLLLKA